MLNIIQEMWQQTSKYLRLFKDDLQASLTAGEITRLSWARRVKSMEELPACYQDHFSRSGIDPSAFPYAVLTPTFEGFLKREKEKLIYIRNGNITILEKSSHQPVENAYRLADLNYLEVGQVLLNAWLRLDGIDGSGKIARSSLRYNAVNQALFQPFIDPLRCPSTSTEPANLERERSKFKALQTINFKFMNFGRRSMLPGEKVESFIFQPELRHPRLKIANRGLLSKSLILAHMIILTDRECILVQDDPESQRLHASFQYGGVWNYIPLRKVQRTSIVMQQNGLITLGLHLPAERKIERNFSMDRIEEVKEFSASISAMRSLLQHSISTNQ